MWSRPHDTAALPRLHGLLARCWTDAVSLAAGQVSFFEFGGCKSLRVTAVRALVVARNLADRAGPIGIPLPDARGWRPSRSRTIETEFLQLGEQLVATRLLLLQDLRLDFIDLFLEFRPTL